MRPLQHRARDACKFSTSATAGGGLVSDARLRLLLEGGTTAEMAWTLEVLLPGLWLASRTGSPQWWGHDRIVEIAIPGFRRRLESC